MGKEHEIRICTGRSCKSRFSEYIIMRLNREKDMGMLPPEANISECACRWRCKEWPVVEIDWQCKTSMNPVSTSEYLRNSVFHAK